MKAIIFRPDGTRIEIEGTPEEIARLAPPGAAVIPQQLATCICYWFEWSGQWCPVHGYPVRYPGIFYAVLDTPNACAGNALPLIWQA